MQDGAEHAGQLPEFCLTVPVKTALGNKAVDDIRLPQRDDTVTLLPRGDLPPGFDGRVHHERPASVGSAFPAKQIRNLIASAHLHQPDGYQCNCGYR